MVNSTPTAPSVPNIVLIVSDDHGYGDRGRLGVDPLVSTPRLDQLAAEGVDCTQAYVTAPICSPSRAGLLAGRYQQRWGARWFDTSAVPPQEYPTIAECLRSEGYATGYFGKVHYGKERDGDRGTPPEHGFDESLYGLAGQSMGRLHYMLHSQAARDELGEDVNAVHGVGALWEGRGRTTRPAEPDGFLTEIIGERARDFITSHRDEPFFAYVAFNAVHNFTWQLPEAELRKRGLPTFADWYPGTSDYVDWYDGAISPDLPHGREYYRAQLELMDREIGRIVDHVDDLGLGEDTLVIYLTDNGGSTCNFGRNDPLRGTKYTLFEGGIRVPFIVRWPGTLPAGTVHDGLVSSMDILPTVLAAAGAGERLDADLDGHDQLPFLSGRRQGSPHRELHWDCGWSWAVRSGEWKLVVTQTDSAVAKGVQEVERTVIPEAVMLTHLGTDVGEQHNRAEDSPAKVAQLTAAHQRWLDRGSRGSQTDESEPA